MKSQYFAHQQTLDRFWSYVDKKSPDDCWDWIGGLRNGYGAFSYGSGRVKRKLYSHRFMWQIMFGHPKEKKVLHKCDRPSCVNPAHLFLGTMKDNTQDAMRKGRFNTRGENNGDSVLTEDNVREIRRILSTNCLPQRIIAQKFGVSQNTISDIKIGRSWAWLE